MKSLISVLILSFSHSLWANSLYVAPVQGTNISETEAKTIRELVKVEVQNEGSHRLVDRMDQANFYLQTKIIKFKTYTISMVRWQGNNEVSKGQWKANSLSDLETQISVAVKEVLNSKINKKQAVLFKNEKSLGQQAAEKKQRANFERVEARRQAMLGFGPAYFNKMNSGGSGIGFTAGYVWNIDDHFDLGLKSDFAISTLHSDAYVVAGKIFTNYFFSSTDISPFAGAGFGYGWASVHDNQNIQSDDSASGFALSLQAGVKFFRTSTVNFAVAGEYTTIFDRSDIGEPGVFLLRFSFLY